MFHESSQKVEVPLFGKEGLGEICRVWLCHDDKIPLNPPLPKGEASKPKTSPDRIALSKTFFLIPSRIAIIRPLLLAAV